MTDRPPGFLWSFADDYDTPFLIAVLEASQDADLLDPATAETARALAPTWTGTVEELLDTAAALTEQR